MRLKASSLVTSLLGKSLYAVFYATVLYPWCDYLLVSFSGYTVPESHIWFWVLAVLAGNAVTALWERWEGKKVGRLLVFAAFLAIDYGLTQLSGLPMQGLHSNGLAPFYVGAFVNGALMVIGFRYDRLSSGQKDFMQSFGLWSTVLIISLLLKDALHLSVNIWQVFSFFAVGVTLALFHRFLGIEANFATNRQSWIAVTFTVLVFIFLFAVLFTFGFSEETSHLILTPIAWVCNRLLDLVGLVVGAVVMLIGPLLTMLINFLMRLFGKPRELEPQPESMGNYEEQIQNLKTGQMSDTASTVLQIILLVAACVLVFVILNRYRKKNAGESYYDEERVSVFNPEDIRKDFLNLFQALADRFRRKSGDATSIYDASTYAIRIRELYYRFLLQMNQRIPFKKYFTPTEYLDLVKEQIPSDSAKQLTQIYEAARYGNSVGAEDLSLMEISLKNVSQPEGNNENT